MSASASRADRAPFGSGVAGVDVRVVVPDPAVCDRRGAFFPRPAVACFSGGAPSSLRSLRTDGGADVCVPIACLSCFMKLGARGSSPGPPTMGGSSLAPFGGVLDAARFFVRFRTDVVAP